MNHGQPQPQAQAQAHHQLVKASTTVTKLDNFAMLVLIAFLQFVYMRLYPLHFLFRRRQPQVPFASLD
jgi:hypothetical protein